MWCERMSTGLTKTWVKVGGSSAGMNILPFLEDCTRSGTAVGFYEETKKRSKE